MELLNEQAIFGEKSEKDIIEIPYMKRITASLIVIAMTVIPAALYILFDGYRIIDLLEPMLSREAIIPLFGAVYTLLIGLIFFLMSKKNRFIFEFNDEYFIAGKKAVKWADMFAISYGCFWSREEYHITIYYKQAVENNPKKNDILRQREYGEKNLKETRGEKITGGIYLNMDTQKAAELIVDKFYKYYGASHGLKFKVVYSEYNYEVVPILGKNNI